MESNLYHIIVSLSIKIIFSYFLLIVAFILILNYNYNEKQTIKTAEIGFVGMQHFDILRLRQH